MDCSSCGAANKEGRKFCGSCGGALPRPCPSCGFENDATDRFCGGCGTHLEQASTPAPAPAPAPATTATPTPAVGLPTSAPERRHLTIMFCDLVGSTALSTRMDPEDLRELIKSFQGACEAEIRKRDGFVARYMGDGLLVYFGYPRAHERDAERAVEAGLGIVEACRALNVSVRVGIATGIAVVGDLIGEGASGEAAVVGQTPNLAARLQGLAAENTVVISPATRRLVRGRYAAQSLGAQTLKGFDTPVEAFRVTGLARETGEEPGAPLVGRERELDLLDERWHAAREGEGQVVLLTSEAGLGKSRLVSALARASAGESSHVVHLEGTELLRSSPLAPFVDWLRRALTERVDGPASRAALEAVLPGDDAAERRTAIAELLELADRDRALGDLPAEARRERIAVALTDHLQALAADRPTLVIFEDLQWADAGSLDVLGRVVRSCVARPMLVVLTGRPGEVPDWANLPHVTRLHLGKLTRIQTRALIESLATEVDLSARIVDRIVDRADGVPLFVEELTRGVLESESLSIPATLQESLLARLDRSPRARDLAQVAAVLGRDFGIAALATVAGRSVEDLREPLRELTHANILIDHEDGRFSFRHALLRDVAYESLLRDARRAHHGAAARALEANAILAEGQPELVAYHLTEAGERAEAVTWWRRAAARTEAHGDPEASLNHLARAHGLLAAAESGPDAVARIEVEIDRANNLRTIARLDEALEILDAIEPLAERLERHDALARSWFTRGNILFWKDPPRCQAAHERALAEAERAGSVESQARALGGLGDGAYLRGAFTVSQDCFTRCVDLARSAGLTDIEADNGPMLSALALMLTGGSVVEEFGTRALEVARRARRPRAHVLAHMPLAMWHNMHGEPERGLALALSGLDLLENQYRILFFRSGFRSILAQSYLQLGRLDEARSILEHLTNPGPEDRGGAVYAPFVHTCIALIDRDPAGLDTALERADLRAWNQSLDRFIPTFAEACIQLRAWDAAERALAAVELAPPAEFCGLLESHIEACRALADLARDRDPAGARARLAKARALAARMELVTLLEAIDAAAGDHLPAASSR